MMTQKAWHTILAVATFAAILGSSLTAAGQEPARTSVRTAGQEPARTDVSGKWTFQVETQAGGGTPTVTFTQTGEKLTGHYSSANLGEAELSGVVKGRSITFSFTASVQDTKLEVTYSGTVESKDTMKGTVNLGGLGEGTFTAKRQ